MFRLNFGTVILCLVMNQPYINYYFVPLISFWFTVAYLALCLAAMGSGEEYFPRNKLWIIIALLTAMITLISEVLVSLFSLTNYEQDLSSLMCNREHNQAYRQYLKVL